MALDGWGESYHALDNASVSNDSGDVSKRCIVNGHTLWFS